MNDLLSVRDLSVSYYERGRTVRAVDGVDLILGFGRILAVVGESGCGKTTMGLSLLDLVPYPGRIDAGAIVFDGRDVLTLKREELRAVRGRQISMIFQDAVSGLNPVMAVGAQVEEIIETHLRVSRKEARSVAREALARQGLAPVERIASSFPFQLSGGMCQRVMIAIATVLRPRLIIADEPTAALDVTVQAAILHELELLRHDLGVSIMLITHDLGVVAQVADEVAVMYAGPSSNGGQRRRSMRARVIRTRAPYSEPARAWMSLDAVSRPFAARHPTWRSSRASVRSCHDAARR